jgi:hypothetical protein
MLPLDHLERDAEVVEEWHEKIVSFPVSVLRSQVPGLRWVFLGLKEETTTENTTPET